jgi:glycosidase
MTSDKPRFAEQQAVEMEFHISRQSRDFFRFDESLFSSRGNIIFPNLHAARTFAQRINEKRDVVSFPERAARASQINAMGLIDEILHLVASLYRQQRNPQATEEALQWLEQELGQEAVDAALRRFADDFPTVAVYRGEADPEAYLDGSTAGVPHRLIVLEELIMLWLANLNPAFLPYAELFDDAAMEKETAYTQIATGLRAFFDSQPVFGPDGQNLIDMLRSPAVAVPHSLFGQLEYIREHWGSLLGRYLYRLLGGLDLIREEEKAVFAGPGPAQVLDFTGLDLEPERFSPDRDWMPRLVLIAKNAYVWLDQLSRRYGRSITHLDQIPDEELDALARHGFSGLWLIGLWERSPASKRIKQLCGNADAVASAYSLYDYQIAADLGGSEALEGLKARAWRRGIRLASDMVPNHVGITSKWVTEHPDWFVSLDHSPFPSYSFGGPDLSDDPRMGVYLEDHYYSRSDAAVVFRRRDHWAGSEEFIYHGNDGTSMPWNDTAQLNYLKPEVREAVIQTILHVARQFPVIRFDAAMTLTKKHYQRLWFPEPGTGGAIPTRSEHGLTKEQFDAAMPNEFWREVVDRVAAEVPDTLLLAEAFWLLEGYFVRTLGMHRVYNSAFMHMLRDEDNAKYRTVLKNTLEFEPEVLKRYVNFMNNPDEETAVAQFGKGDKYFGICTMMATLPGVPMFGHGQLEGYYEKYGMEYRRAYWDEWPDEALVARHEREVCPLLHRRHLFAEVRDFLLYDFYTPEGSVNEDVFAYSNRCGDERALVVYHNRFATARGWIRSSAAYAAKAGTDGGQVLVQRSLAEGLGLCRDAQTYSIFRDYVSGFEFIRSNRDLWENGLYSQLDAYKCHVFLDWREVQDDDRQQYAQLAAYLNGRGVPSIEEALRELFLQAVHMPFRGLVNAAMLRRLADASARHPQSIGRDHALLLDEVERTMVRLLREIKNIAGGGDELAIAHEVRQRVAVALRLPQLPWRTNDLPAAEREAIMALLREHQEGDASAQAVLFCWLFTHALGRAVADEGFAQRSRSWIDEWLLGRIVETALRELGADEGAAQWSTALLKPLIAHQAWYEQEGTEPERAYLVLRSWLADPDLQRVLQVNRYRDVLWFNKEALQQWLRAMLTVAVVAIAADPRQVPEQADQKMVAAYGVIQRLLRAEEESAYQVDRLLEAARR